MSQEKKRSSEERKDSIEKRKGSTERKGSIEKRKGSNEKRKGSNEIKKSRKKSIRKSKESKDTSDDSIQLKTGTVVIGVHKTFVVMKLLGKGGFGAVYKVYDQNDKEKFYAMKVEKKVDSRKHSKLKMEVAILKLVSEERSPEFSHFTEIVDRGKKDTFFFLVMSLVGKSLDDLQKERPKQVFSIATGLGTSSQCLEAIEDLTKWGFIHRDIKPANYACGLDNKKRIVYLLDFGIARRIVNKNNELKAPRTEIKFKGTVRFASINCHKGLELGPRDGVESWIYLFLSQVVVGGLPWKFCRDKVEVLVCKQESRTKLRKKLFFGLSSFQDSLDKMLDYIDSLTYSDKVDYKFLYTLLRVSAAQCGADLNAPYDWEISTPTKLKQDVTAISI